MFLKFILDLTFISVIACCYVSSIFLKASIMVSFDISGRNSIVFEASVEAPSLPLLCRMDGCLAQLEGGESSFCNLLETKPSV